LKILLIVNLSKCRILLPAMDNTTRVKPDLFASLPPKAFSCLCEQLQKEGTNITYEMLSLVNHSWSKKSKEFSRKLPSEKEYTKECTWSSDVSEDTIRKWLEAKEHLDMMLYSKIFDVKS